MLMRGCDSAINKMKKIVEKMIFFFSYIRKQAAKNWKMIQPLKCSVNSTKHMKEH